LAGEIEWLKLPPDLQHRFFELAEEESKRLSRTIEELERTSGRTPADAGGAFRTPS
jgi:TRAP-type C4-dicarboxylate transport system substrate-binding protein